MEKEFPPLCDMNMSNMCLWSKAAVLTSLGLQNNMMPIMQHLSKIQRKDKKRYNYIVAAGSERRYISN